MAERAAAMSVTLSRDYGKALAEAEFVTSTVTGDDALDAARSALEFLKPGTVFLDFNTITRKTAREIAALMDAKGVQYVDVAVFGSFHAVGYRTPLLIAGRDTDRVVPWMEGLGFKVKVLNDQAGDASAVKMLRSIMMKGIEALAVECLVAAREQGLLEEVLDCFGDVDAATFRGMLDILVTTHIPHCKRRMEEVEKVNKNLIETGIEPLMSAATLANHRRTLAANVAGRGGRPAVGRGAAHPRRRRGEAGAVALGGGHPALTPLCCTAYKIWYAGSAAAGGCPGRHLYSAFAADRFGLFEARDRIPPDIARQFRPGADVKRATTEHDEGGRRRRYAFLLQRGPGNAPRPSLRRRRFGGLRSVRHRVVACGGAQAETLSISCGAVGVELKLCKEGVEAWSAKSGVDVRIVSTPNSSTERLALYQQILAAKADDIDLFQVDVVWPGTLGSHFVDLSKHLDGEGGHFPALIRNNTVDGRLVALPWWTDAGVLYYRADLLKKHGAAVPATWAELTRRRRRS